MQITVLTVNSSKDLNKCSQVLAFYVSFKKSVKWLMKGNHDKEKENQVINVYYLFDWWELDKDRQDKGRFICTEGEVDWYPPEWNEDTRKIKVNY